MGGSPAEPVADQDSALPFEVAEVVGDCRGAFHPDGVYQCRGSGTYTLTIDHINLKYSNNGVYGEWTPVFPKAVTATGRGC
ncbi:hypothetical protein [Streptomyces sp. NPDC088196]|uniref:hypothetical protein n=1 Tax=Streptomyces sp. NPDC088196 TaxID=3154868 RepID=UPI00344B4214